MSIFSEELRATVVSRAGGSCEYCHLPTRGQVGRFPIDHVIPRSSGGSTELDNLALACPHCNGRKWSHTDGTDVLAGKTVPLFNPRMQVWADHFEWSSTNLGEILGMTGCGRATIGRLEMNHPDLLAVRILLAKLELFPNKQT